MIGHVDHIGNVAVRRVAPGIEVHSGRTRGPRCSYVLSGSDLLLVNDSPFGRVRCRARERRLGAGLLAVVETGEVVSVDQPAESCYRALHLPPGLLAALPEFPPEISLGNSANHRIAWVVGGPGLCDLVDDVDTDDGLAEFLARTRLGRRSGLWIAAAERAAHAVVCRVRDHLRQHFARKVMLEELAQKAGMSRFALVRAFAREIGIPPHTYQIHLRVQRARELIAGGSSLSEVSLEVGFTDQSHLNRHFKRLIGITPGLYARSLVGDSAPPRMDPRIPFFAAITDLGYATNNVQETARRAV